MPSPLATAERLEGWPQPHSFGPFFETRAAAAKCTQAAPAMGALLRMRGSRLELHRMTDIKAVARELVVANRILSREDVVDAYGHVSVRHPDNPNRFLIACSIAPELVNETDIVELDLDCAPIKDDGRPLYHERFIHGAIYQTRPDVHAVVHAHSEDVLPFAI